VSHAGPEPLEIRIYGGIWWDELYDALARYGLRVDEECPEAVEPSPEERIRRTALALHERGVRVSAPVVAEALRGQEAGARFALILQVLAELRGAGLLPPASAGGRPRKPIPSPYRSIWHGNRFSLSPPDPIGSAPPGGAICDVDTPHSPPEPNGSAPPHGGATCQREESPSPPPAPLAPWQPASPGGAAPLPGVGGIAHGNCAQPNPLKSGGPGALCVDCEICTADVAAGCGEAANRPVLHFLPAGSPRPALRAGPPR